MKRDRIESTRTGRISQAYGLALIAGGIFLAVAGWLAGDPVAVVAVNAGSIGGGIFIIFGPGRRMVRNAREHRKFMDAHRKRVAFREQQRKALWS